MKIKIVTLLKTKFNISNPHILLKELKKNGNIDIRSLRKVFEDTPPERFDINVVKKYIKYVSSFNGKRGILYEPTYWMYRCNITYEEGEKKVIELKKNKSTSKESFIKRHGEEKGLQMFEKFQKTSSYSTSDEWFKGKYGDEWKEKKEYEMRRKSKRCIEYWIDKGYSSIDAEIKVIEHQKYSSGVYREYYLNLGYSDDEIDIIMSQINQKKKNHQRNTKFLKEKYPESWKEIYLDISRKYRERMEELGLWIGSDIIDDFKKYRYLVNRYTNESILFYGDLVENLNLRSKEYHLDHKYSIKMGFINDIDPKIIGSIVNIEIIPAKINFSKRQNCSITKQKLLKDYKNFKEKNENLKD